MYKNWRDLIRPKQLQFEKESLSDTYGKFFAEPFERGFATTLGNSLRRILLSSLQGSAITSVRIKGVLHEFSAIQGVTEDVTDIILNLKGVRLKLHSVVQATIRVVHTGEGVVKAGDFVVGHNVEIMNPEHHIATCGKDAHFEMDMTVKMGKGYVSADKNRDEKAPVGTIPIDSIFSPIKKVNFTISNARVGQMTDYDKLTLEIWTDGSVKPDDALAYSAKIMKEQLSIFINFDEEAEPQAPEESQDEIDKINENLYRTVEELELSVRSANCLKNAGIKLIGELVSKTEAEMLKTQNFGRKSLNEIKDILSDMGLTFGMKLDSFPEPDMLRRLRGEQNEEE
ncbi:DNA-directed RNA polymerase subunit alpha [Pelobacter propionicus]|uniref:DNA-directed RNA polymerase subunit alpha n=1 Tax=Pelobacter propionicus (strain DSM 2379 / NBRC 103807 / OttBd1) TaxID=338966 RepID=RPOA_PELPD|nr:DNA-directed RNA polymerase subunit alpha [Pelobacter propionicus]A1ALW7.1 RecName: Full=DNA-directed RNA polymerase subunit alpha; Short=RNAP subunit alpha; AltName: Full=RNA polymerase subunit alpha; AltName: Full=Transcriptase subunit alpha [Pelobacter propionicus DSM 2379]ABK98337.1 DNA-directed RNA polymerase subunit alpha [Pelobacter propionicus DSM 2379]